MNVPSPPTELDRSHYRLPPVPTDAYHLPSLEHVFFLFILIREKLQADFPEQLGEKINVLHIIFITSQQGYMYYNQNHQHAKMFLLTMWPGEKNRLSYARHKAASVVQSCMFIYRATAGFAASPFELSPLQ